MQEDLFKESAKIAHRETGISDHVAEILFRTADLSLRFGAKNVSTTSKETTLFPPRHASLIIENSASEELTFSVTWEGYQVSANALGVHETESVRLYLRALSVIQTHCEVGKVIQPC